MEPFKNIYNKKSITQMAEAIYKIDTSFDRKVFIKDASKNLSKLEMKQRVVQISESLYKHLPYPYKKNISILIKTLSELEGFILWPYTYYIETYGLDHLDASIKALYKITSRFTSEFGIRAFIEKYPDQVYHYFEKWADDSCEHIRRWTSEGLRPNLPWGKKVSTLNLKRSIKLLDKLKEDTSLYVRKSVANHMNDITRLDEALALKTLKKWNQTKSEDTKWIVKHASRTLLKKGHPESLALLGYDIDAKVKLSNFSLSKKTIKEGESFELNFDISHKEKTTQKLMIDYAIHYLKANGSHSKKVFKLKSIDLEANEVQDIKKKVSFKKVTTRVHYAGKHFIEILVNGRKLNKESFKLNL